MTAVSSQALAEPEAVGSTEPLPMPRLRRTDAWAAVGLKWLGVVAVVLTLAWLGWQVSNYKIDVVKKVTFVGHADDAAYATMGRNLAEGKGLQVPYVSWFFNPYSPEIVHREDHWPPLMGFLIAPFVYFLGPEAWVTKLAPIYMGSIGLPLAAAALAMVYSRRAYVGLAAGLLMLANTTPQGSGNSVFTESMRTLSDVPVAAIVAGFCAALLGARYWRWLHIVAGVLAAAAFYAKGSQILLLGLYPLLVALIEDERGEVYAHVFAGAATAAGYYLLGLGAWVVMVYPLGLMGASVGRWVIALRSNRGAAAPLPPAGQPPKGGTPERFVLPIQALLAIAAIVGYAYTGQALVLTLALPVVAVAIVGLPTFFRSKWPTLGMVTTVVLLAPFLYSNWRLYGNPLHSTQNYVSGYMGFVGWDAGTYKPYWGKDLPKTSDRWTRDWASQTGDPRVTYWEYVADNREFYARCGILGVTNGWNLDAWDDLGPWGLRVRDGLIGPYAAARRAGTNQRVAAARAAFEKARPADPVEAERKWEQTRRAIPDYLFSDDHAAAVAARKPVAEWRDPVAAVPGVLGGLWVPVLVGLTGVGMVAEWAWRRRAAARVHGPEGAVDATADRDARVTVPWLLGPTLAILLVAVSQWAFVVHFWGRADMARLCFMDLPLLAALGCTAVSRVIEAPVNGLLGAWRLWRPRTCPAVAGYWHVAVTLIAVGVCLHWVRANEAWLREYPRTHERVRAYPWVDQPEAVKMGQWFARLHPKAVFMSRYCWQINYYAADTNRSVNIPSGSPEQVVAIMKYYRVGFYADEPGARPQMSAFVHQHPAAFRPAANPTGKPEDAPPANLYVVDFSADDYLRTLPSATAEELLPSSTRAAIR